LRILVIPAGTRGDVQPALALAAGLRERGHDVRFAAAPNFEGWVRSYGLPFLPFGRDVEVMLREVGISVPRALECMRREIHGQFEETAGFVEGVDAVVGATLQAAVRSHCEIRGIPYFHVFYSPQLLPSDDHPPPFFTRHGWPAWANALAWSGTRRLSDVLFLRFINEERRALGLPPAADLWSYVLSGHLLLAADELIAPLPPDVSRPVVTTGAWMLPERDDIDPGLARFLEEGPAPVYLGFGSMPDKSPRATMAIVADAVRKSGVRALVSSGWAKLQARDLPDTMRVIGQTPHGKLFPRVRGVVHHGGAGTTATAARAGVPQLIVPHLFDQHHWAHRIQAVGLSPQPLPRHRFTAELLADRLRQLTRDDALLERARRLAKLLPQDGVNRAIAHIESTLGVERELPAVGT
jgi:UDP:flavonoid glycosyltransferase YjiC (YdhE family)